VSQIASVYLGAAKALIELPAPEEQAMPGVSWGSVDAFPSPAYWAYQVFARRICGETIRSRLGASLTEEVAACILGGHGIPARVGVAAFHHLKACGLLAYPSSESELLAQLIVPLMVDGRSVRYRFARQKAKYLCAALHILFGNAIPPTSGRVLRDWLLKLPGVGYKTASWIARNHLDADDVAILDVHILRAGRIAGFLSLDLTVEHDYLALESQFLRFSRAIEVRPSELDAVIWYEMASSRATIRRLNQSLTLSASGAQIRRTDTSQLKAVD
jgi:N-glycosylase/DNA lyase